MAGNFFDQFDPPPPPSTPPTQPDGSNFFDQFDPPGSKPMSTMDTAADVAAGAGTGVVKGTAGLAGLPGDVQDMSNSLWDRASNYAIHGLLKATGQIKTPQDEADFQQLTGAMKPAPGLTSGSLPTSSQITGAVESATGKLPEPKTTLGKYAETAGEFLPAAVAGPESLGKKLAYGVAAPAIGSEVAGQYAQGTPLEPYARMAGAVAGGVGGHAVEQGAAALGKVFEPVTSKGQTAIAANMLHDEAADPVALKASLDAPPTDMLPGFNPTTFQQTGDIGLGAAEKVAELQDPRFNARRASNEQGMTNTLQGIQPGGSPEDLAAGLRTHLQALDDAEAGKQAAALTGAQDAATAAGGQQSADFYGRQIQGAVQPEIDAANRQISTNLDAMGGRGTPEQAGAALRAPEQAGKDAARIQRKAFYNAVDPDGTMNVVGAPARQGAVDLEKGISPMAAQPAGEEAAILAQMKSMPDVVPFRDLQALDSRITAARTAEYQAAGESPSYARLGQLKGHVQGAISDGVANQVAYERHGIATGQMQASDADLEQRLLAKWNLDSFGSKSAQGSFERTGTGPSGFSASGTAGRTSSRGAGDEAAGRFPAATSDQRVSPDPLRPNFDQAAADRLNLGKQVHAAYSQTYKEGPTAARLKTNGFAGQYRMIDSGVPDTVFAKGPKGAEQLQTFMRASNNSPAAQNAVENYAAMTLRRAAERPDGTLDPKRFLTWATGYRDAIRANPQLMQRFSDINRATESLKRFAPFTQDAAPSAIPEMFFHAGPSGGEGVRNLRGLIGNQMTEQHLGDYAASKLRSSAMNPDGTFDPARVAQFNKVHGPALDELPGLRDKFSTAAKATEAVAEAARTRKAALDQYQRGAVGQVMGVTDPADISRVVGGIFASKTGASQMQDLAMKAKAAGPDAVQGLRAAIADHIDKTFVSNTEAGLTGTNKISANSFQNFVKRNGPVLSHVFTPEEVSTMGKMSDAITMMNRSRDAVLVKGQSGTTQLTRMLKHAEPEHSNLFENIFKLSFAAREAGETLANIPFVGHLIEKAGFPVAVGAAGVKTVINGMRAAGMTKASELFREAQLHPDIARLLLQKYTPANAKNVAATLGTKLARLSPFYGQVSQGQPGQAPEPVQRAAGGRVEPTKAQAEAGNYEKRHTAYAGLPLSIENEKGSQRRGVGKGGKPWSVTMPAAYGYIRGTVGADGDHVDCYLGPKAWSPYAFVIDQVELPSRKFDEEKLMLGFATRADAVKAYEAGFSDGKGAQRIGKITPVETKDLKDWAATRKPKPERARGGGIFGVPSYGQMLGPTKKAMGFGFAAGGTVLPEKARKPGTNDYHDRGDPVAVALSIAHGR